MLVRSGRTRRSAVRRSLGSAGSPRLLTASTDFSSPSLLLYPLIYDIYLIACLHLQKYKTSKFEFLFPVIFRLTCLLLFDGFSEEPEEP
ncbi:hypothetical protein OE88DRAFT_1153564 [Heliocybe sulcata]|uniref:Uncharacterized protein n=1 Tax=Heliocybe sulcata TaxID=5364 RepID=A0A5C3N9V1_9AGAM|nr:hypothetical protein OE88DRAFT_1153564 [Heliocybe sulcata]